MITDQAQKFFISCHIV